MSDNQNGPRVQSDQRRESLAKRFGNPGLNKNILEVVLKKDSGGE